MQKEGYKGLTGLGREKRQKNLIEALIESYRERKFWKLFERKFEHVKIKFEKLFIQFSIDRKLGSIDRKCFDWTSINRASIKMDRGWPKFLIAISIDWKTGSIDRNSGNFFIFFLKQTSFVQKLVKSLNFKNKMHEYEMKCFSKTQVLNPVFPKFKIFNPFS